MFTLIVSLIGGWVGYELSKFRLSYELKSLDNIFIVSFLGSIWFIPYIRTYGINYSPLFIGSIFYKVFDQGWSEEFGGQNIYLTSVELSLYLQWWQNNNLRIYLLRFMIWVIILLLLILYLSSLYIRAQH